MRRMGPYIAGRFIRMILMAVAAFTILFVVVDAFDNINRWMEKSPGWGGFLRYYAYGLPYIVVLVMPWRCCCAASFW
jgi:lipopolysaccharide export LptBFGC system permease protein LptF